MLCSASSLQNTCDFHRWGSTLECLIAVSVKTQRTDRCFCVLVGCRTSVICCHLLGVSEARSPFSLDLVSSLYQSVFEDCFVAFCTCRRCTSRLPPPHMKQSFLTSSCSTVGMARGKDDKFVNLPNDPVRSSHRSEGFSGRDGRQGTN